MTKFIFIRHGRPDYTTLINKNFKGHGIDLAFLSPEGIEQAKTVAKDEILKGAELLLSSPYTRCMHTASIISNELNLPIIGEVDLHEWLPDLSFDYNYNDKKELVNINFHKALEEYENPIENKEYDFEVMKDVKKRVLNVLKKYLNYNKVIVVAHEGVMHSLSRQRHYFCTTYSIDLNQKIIDSMLSSN